MNPSVNLGTGTATCPAGKKAIAGGFNTHHLFQQVYSSYPTPFGNAPTTWNVLVLNRGTGILPANFDHWDVYVVCATVN